LQAKGDLLHFSKWLFISNCIYFLQGKTMEFVLGRTVGAHALGIYNIGAEIATMPSTEMIAPINRVIYPAYAKLSKDLEQLQKRFIEILQMICAIGFPVAIGLFLFADEVVRLALGPNWLEAIPIVRIIAFSGLVGAVQSNLFLILVATGRPRINTTFSASLLVLSLPLTVVASLHYGILGAAYAHFIVSFLGLCGISVVFCRAIDMPVGQLLSVAFRPAVASVIMAACAAGLDQASVGHSIANPALKIATLGPLYTAAYIVSIYGLWFAGGKPAGAERTLADLATKKLANWKQRRQKS
jgi:O-antigen/teichoic acid export membrane protein